MSKKTGGASNLRDVQVADSIVKDNERMLADGFYAEVTLSYDPLESHDAAGRPFRIALLRPIQMSKPDVLDVLARGRRAFTTADWRDFLIRSAGLEPEALDEPAKRVVLLRMAPFVERNYNFVELGPRGTGKSHIYQQLSPYSHLLSGGKATVAKMFVNMANGQRGLVCQYDVVCFDEIAGISFDQKDGVNIMKGYMASGEFSRGKESIRAEGGIVMVGNFEVDVEQQQRIGHLLSPLPRDMRDDTAFHDRIHAYAPGWNFPKLNPNEHLTDHFGLVSDFLSECWTRLRQTSRVSVLQNRVFWAEAPPVSWTRIKGESDVEGGGGMVGARRVKRAGSARTEGARRATGVGADGAAVGAGGLGARAAVEREPETDVVLRLLRGESLEMVSREVGVELYRLEAWQARALAGLELGLKAQAGEPLAAELDAAKRHIGELSMEIELLRERARCSGVSPPFSDAEVATMCRATSATTGRRYGLKRVCGTWERSRSALYARRARLQRPERGDGPARRGPTPALSDAQLLAAIRSDLARSRSRARAIARSTRAAESSTGSESPGRGCARDAHAGAALAAPRAAG